MSSQKLNYDDLRRLIENASVEVEMLTDVVDDLKGSISRLCGFFKNLPPEVLDQGALVELETAIEQGFSRMSERFQAHAASLEASFIPVIDKAEELQKLVEHLERKQDEGDEWKDRGDNETPEEGV